ncbi:iron ABC transporter permease [Ideonella sp. DXS29W]|uniref:Iron ABC transporter permease n=1 Tax=Ideonella lacteola TaxID=2984193 RepID=A0ABU9BIY9_9BURK
MTTVLARPSAVAAPARPEADAARRWRLLAVLAMLSLLLLWLGLMAGPSGLSWSGWLADLGSDQAALIVGEIRAPRTLGAWAVGALLGLAGALAQGLFRNPLADPYLLGTAAGAGLAVVLVLAGASLGGVAIGLATAQWLARLGIVLAAFVGALTGLLMTLALARGAHSPMRLLLSGVVVAVVLGAIGDLVTFVSPDALRGKQSFLLGSTGFLGWGSVAVLVAGFAVALPLARRYARALDALTLGEDSAASLGLDLPRIRLVLVGLLALTTGLAVSQAGLVAFVGLVAPHLVRRHAPAPQAFTMLASAAMGGVLLLAADVMARCVIAPQELPVGVLTAVLGGGYLMRLLSRQERE